MQTDWERVVDEWTLSDIIFGSSGTHGEAELERA